MNETVHIVVHELCDSWSSRRHPDKRLGLIGLLTMHTQPVSMGDTGGGGGKVTGSPAPWAADVECLLTDIDAGARDLEANLRRVLGWADLTRGGSRHNTADALRRLPEMVDLLEHQRPEHWLVRGEPHPRKGYRVGHVQKSLVQWHRQARIVLGAERRHTLLPFSCTGRVGEATETEDQPVCGQKALRQRPNDNAIVCGACGETYTEDELYEWFVPSNEETSG